MPCLGRPNLAQALPAAGKLGTLNTKIVRNLEVSYLTPVMNHDGKIPRGNGNPH